MQEGTPSGRPPGEATAVEDPLAAQADALPADDPLASRPVDGSDSPARPRKKRGRLIGVLVFVLLSSVGGLTQAFREAGASPEDKAACSATAAMFESEGEQILPALSAWRAATDERISKQAVAFTLAAQAERWEAANTALNEVVERCQEISSDFDRRFEAYCTAHPGECEESFSLSPF